MASSNKSNHLLGRNPVIRKLSKVTETDYSDACTYAGVAKKLGFFIVMVVLGIAACLFVKYGGLAAGGEIILDKQIFEDGENVIITSTEAIIIAIVGIVFIISPLLAAFIRVTVPVTGSLYCASTGYLLCWLAVTFGDIYRAPILLALVITLMIVATMGYLYGAGIIKVTQKMKTVIMTAGIAILGASLLVFIGSLIPATRGLVAQLAANPVLSIGGSVILVTLGTFFLLVDFDTIRECVEGSLPKKYEWYAAYGLAFSVIWLYFKVLDLILKIMGSSKN